MGAVHHVVQACVARNANGSLTLQSQNRESKRFCGWSKVPAEKEGGVKKMAKTWKNLKIPWRGGWRACRSWLEKSIGSLAERQTFSAPTSKDDIYPNTYTLRKINVTTFVIKLQFCECQCSIMGKTSLSLKRICCQF